MSGGGGNKSLNDNPSTGQTNPKKMAFLDRADVDDVTKSEIKNLSFGYGSDDLSIEELIADYESGKGKYGIRKKNMQVAKMAGDRPGGSQLNLAITGNKAIGAGMPTLVPGAPETASLINDIKKNEKKKAGET